MIKSKSTVTNDENGVNSNSNGIYEKWCLLTDSVFVKSLNLINGGIFGDRNGNKFITDSSISKQDLVLIKELRDYINRNSDMKFQKQTELMDSLLSIVSYEIEAKSKLCISLNSIMSERNKCRVENDNNISQLVIKDVKDALNTFSYKSKASPSPITKQASLEMDEYFDKHELIFCHVIEDIVTNLKTYHRNMLDSIESIFDSASLESDIAIKSSEISKKVYQNHTPSIVPVHLQNQPPELPLKKKTKVVEDKQSQELNQNREKYNKKVCAQYSYKAKNPDELSFTKGEILLLVENVDDNWALGQNKSFEIGIVCKKLFKDL